MARKSIYRQLLLDDPELALWHDNLYQGSPITAEVYVRRLGALCRAHKLTPKGLAAMERRDWESASAGLGVRLNNKP